MQNQDENELLWELGGEPRVEFVMLDSSAVMPQKRERSNTWVLFSPLLSPKDSTFEPNQTLNLSLQVAVKVPPRYKAVYLTHSIYGANNKRLIKVCGSHYCRETKSIVLKLTNLSHKTIKITNKCPLAILTVVEGIRFRLVETEEHDSDPGVAIKEEEETTLEPSSGGSTESPPSTSIKGEGKDEVNNKDTPVPSDIPLTEAQIQHELDF